MKKILMLLLLVSINSDLSAQENDQPYITSESLFVWARNGMNVRSGPGTNYQIVDGLQYGDEVQMISRTDVSYNINPFPEIDTSSKKFGGELVGPIILYGEWMKIKSPNGKIGYAVSQYLIALKPAKSKSMYGRIDLNIQSIDTLYHSWQKLDGPGLQTSIQSNYNDGIKTSEYNEGKWGAVSTNFTGYTMAEVFVMMEVKGEAMTIIRNWENEIQLQDDEQMCEISIMKEGDKVTYSISCSC